jgi:hydrogenase maturation protein HypF
MIAAAAEWAGLARVVLTGGCFQNAALLSLAAGELSSRHFEVVTHRQVPPNDGGLAVGQALVAASRLLAREG